MSSRPTAVSISFFEPGRDNSERKCNIEVVCMSMVYATALKPPCWLDRSV